MRSVQIVGGVLAFAGHVFGQVDSKVSCDAHTKICYSGYLEPKSGVYFGIALPKNPVDPYDAIVTITSPVSHYWAGLAWGGTMVWNPLSVVWANGTSAVVSSRFAFGISLPPPYDGASYSYLKGTTANSTHYTVTALCSGCTGWQANDDTRYFLPFNGTTELAWAYGAGAVQNPASNESDFNVHEAVGKWTHDLNAARIDNFDELVKANLLSSAEPSTPSSSVTSKVPTTVATSVRATDTPQRATGAIPASCSGAGNPAFSSVLASGWKATKVLGGLRNPRSIQFDSAGNMLVVESGKGITIHTMGDDGCVKSSKTLVSLNSLNHGIAMSPDGKTLYASSMTTAWSWPYDATAQTVGTRSTIITGMVNGGAHVTRTLAVHPEKANLLVVSHGSNANLDSAGSDPKVGRAIIKVFDLSAVPSSGYAYASSGYTAGYGQRNEVGITFDKNNMLWGVENSGDDFKRTVNGQSTDIHQNNPSEKLHYMGDVTKPNNDWYGYPTCFTVWQPSDFKDKTFKPGDWFVQSPSASFSDDTCSTKAVAPKLILFPHSAPIDIKFDADNAYAYITYHGSWDRSPTTGFKLVQVAFKKDADGNYTTTESISSTTAATDIMANPDVTKCTGNGPSFSSGCFRPAGLYFDKSGRLYMTSDTSQGEVYVLGKS